MGHGLITGGLVTVRICPYFIVAKPQNFSLYLFQESRLKGGFFVA
jgi:hypothetical protein